MSKVNLKPLYEKSETKKVGNDFFWEPNSDSNVEENFYRIDETKIK